MSALTAALEAAASSSLAAATTAVAATAAAIAAASSTTSPTATSILDDSIAMGSAAGPTSSSGGSEDGECRLLGPFALIIQMALGGLALLSLVYKRYRERPQRPVKIWFFDVSKQVVGSVLVHIANVFMSMLTSGRFSVKVAPPVTVQTAAAMLLRRAVTGRDDDTYTPNPCSFYLLNLAIDTTLGIPILLVLLRITTGLVSYTPLGKPIESIQSGHYGSPPRAVWWLKQSFIYFCGLFGMKVCVLLIFLILPWIARVGDWALGWTEGNEKLQIVFVMMLFPLIMNALQYYIIDNFIMEKDHAGHGAHRRLPGEEHEPFTNELTDSEDEHESSEDDDDMASGSDQSVKMSRSRSSLLTQGKNNAASATTSASLGGGAGTSSKNKKNNSVVQERNEYDPDLDGQTVVGSTSSRREAKLPKELLPHE
ncbi:vacuolar membrane protein-domain-containing protein [Microdochium trichocladiopsis]|uniref:Vacuolar membrane protein-domain-containing protein n=1 Tax=Microdochium trichocladiopsis TaxID=1682393 RepID=A0A9P9BT05_9PEZI|nr:vacuolar membrane protein-domain-containing protein [Microdochium trichocladiopsis]KAH7034997.1 vacuolar membrane protein-domain-containing protein [Microdochium trichocladiopsis]